MENKPYTVRHLKTRFKSITNKQYIYRCMAVQNRRPPETICKHTYEKEHKKIFRRVKATTYPVTMQCSSAKQISIQNTHPKKYKTNPKKNNKKDKISHWQKKKKRGNTHHKSCNINTTWCFWNETSKQEIHICTPPPQSHIVDMKANINDMQNKQHEISYNSMSKALAKRMSLSSSSASTVCVCFIHPNSLSTYSGR